VRRKTDFENSAILSSHETVTTVDGEFSISFETIGRKKLKPEFDFQNQIASSQIGVVARLQGRFIELFSQCEHNAARIVSALLASYISQRF